MAQQPRLSAAARSAAADAVLERLDGGRMSIYDGPKPSSPDAAINGATLLVDLSFANTRAFHGARAGLATAFPLGAGTAVATGTAKFFRCWSADQSPVLDGHAGKTDSDLNLSDTSIRAGATVAITSFQYRQAG